MTVPPCEIGQRTKFAIRLRCNEQRHSYASDMQQMEIEQRRSHVAQSLLNSVPWKHPRETIAAAVTELEKGGEPSTLAWLKLLQAATKLPNPEHARATKLLDQLQQLSVSAYLKNHPDRERYESTPAILPPRT